MSSLSSLLHVLLSGLVLVLLAVSASAGLPIQTFESLQPGLVPGTPWQSPGSSLSVSDLAAASGEHSLLLSAPSGSGSTEASIPAIVLGDDPGFVDFWIKPVARTLALQPTGHAAAGQPVEATGVLYVDGAQFLFQRQSNRYSMLALTRAADATPRWLRLGGFAGTPVDFEIEDTGGRAKDWLRLTVRRDLVAGRYDVWVNQRMVGVDLALVRTPGIPEFRWLHRPTGSLLDGALAPMLLDDLQATIEHPLYPDSDRDSMPDVWEAAYEIQLDPAQTVSLDVITPDRAADLDFDSVPKISEYFFGSRPTQVDSDRDGMTDGVEILHGLNPGSGLDAVMDMDGDGFSNLAESQGQGNGNISVPPAGVLTNVVYVKADHEGLQNGNYASPYRTLGAALASPYLASGGRIVVRGEGGPLLHYASDGASVLSNGSLTISRPVTLVGVNMAQVHLQEKSSFATVNISAASATPVFTCENIAFESCWHDDGGAFRIVGTPGEVVFRNCRFTQCSAIDDGGAIYAHAARLTIEDCWFEACWSLGEGGAVHLEGGTQSAIRRTYFQSNSSDTDGGAVSLRGATVSPIGMESCVFLTNGARRGGALAAVDGADATLLQCTVSANAAGASGAGGALYGASTASLFSVSGCIFWNNSANGVAHSHLSGGTPTVTYSSFSGWTTTTGPAGTGNNGSDPIFRAGTVLPSSTAMQDSSNPAHNTSLDFLKNPRWDAPGGTVGTLADRGAFERQADTDMDGMSDDWEARYSLDAANAADADGDADQDGYSNAEECVDKTDPRNSTSLKAPVVFVSPTAGRDWHHGPNAPTGTVALAHQGTRSYPFQSIRRAMLACPANRRIALMDGTYTGPANTSLKLSEIWTWMPHLSTAALASPISLSTKTIRGLNGSGRAILDGGGNARLFDLAFASSPTSSTLTLQNISLRRGLSDLGGAIKAVGSPGLGQLQMNGCVLSANRATSAGGALYVTGPNLQMSKCSLHGNDAPSGGAVALANLSPAGASVTGSASFAHCRFAYNLATATDGTLGQGGAISSHASTFSTFQTRFDSNHAERQGGAVAILSPSGQYPVSFGTGTVFEANTAAERGGGVYAENAGFATTGGAFIANLAGTTSTSGEGGAVFLAHPATTTSMALSFSSRIAQITGTQFLRNGAGLRGGALALADTSPVVTNCAFVENYTDHLRGRGGAIAVFWEVAAASADTPVHVSAPRFIHATFSRNRASLASNVHAEGLTTPWLINTLLGDGQFSTNSPSLLGPRQLHGCQIFAPDSLLTQAEAEASRRNIFGALSLAFDWFHLASPVRIPGDTSATTGGVEPSATVAFTRPTTDIDSESRPAAAAGKFTLMRGCDEPRDSDNDSLPDWFEWLAVNYSSLDAITTISHTHPVTPTRTTLPSATPTNNADADAYTLTQELMNGGRPDAPESERLGRDSDGDGLSDIFERLIPGFDWRNPDQDGDGFSDGWENAHQFSVSQANNPDADTDRDGLTDYWEQRCGTNPRVADSNDNGVTDGGEDSDRDGIPNQSDAHPTELFIRWPRTTQPQFAVIPLGPLPSGLTNLQVYDMNNKGEVVGFADPATFDSTRDRYRVPMIWRAGSWQTVGAPAEAGKMQAHGAVQWFSKSPSGDLSLYDCRMYTTDKSDLTFSYRPIQISDEGTVAAHAIVQNNAQEGELYEDGANPSLLYPLRSLVWQGVNGVPSQYPLPLGRSAQWPPLDPNRLESAFDESFYLAVLGRDGTAILDGGGPDYWSRSARLSYPYANLGTRGHPKEVTWTITSGLSSTGIASGTIELRGSYGGIWNGEAAAILNPLLIFPISIAAMPSPANIAAMGPLAVLDRRGFLTVASDLGTQIPLDPSSGQIGLSHLSTINERGECLWQYETAPSPTPPHLWRNGRLVPVQSLLPTNEWIITSARDLNDAGAILATAFRSDDPNSKIETVVMMPIEVVELAPKLRDGNNEEIQGSEMPLQMPVANSMVEEAPEMNRIAHRELKINVGSALAGKKVLWSMEAIHTPDGEGRPRFGGSWTTAAPQHRNRFAPSGAFASIGYRQVDQETAETIVDDNGYTSIRANVPPMGFNKAQIKIHIEGLRLPMDLIIMEVPAVIVIDPGHGGTDATDFTSSSWNNATSPSGFLEKAMALDYGLALSTSLRSRAETERLNLKVLMTRSTDVSVSGTGRADIARVNGADSIFIIHFNASHYHTARGTLEVRRLNGNINEAEDIDLIEAVLSRMVPAMRQFDQGCNRRDAVSVDTSVTNDGSLGNGPAYFPIRSAYCEVEFIDFGANTKDLKDDAVDILLNTGRDSQNVKQAIVTAMAEGIISNLNSCPRVNP